MPKLPWVITTGGPFEWQSHSTIVPALTKVLSALPAKIVKLWPPLPSATVQMAEEMKRAASCLIIIPPIHLGLELSAILRSQYDLKIPMVILETSHMCQGGEVFFKNRKQIWESDCLVTPSHASGKLIEAALQTRAERISFPILKEDMFPLTAGERKRFRRELGLAPSHQLLVYAGRVTPQKNVLALLHLMARMRKTHPGLRLFVLGNVEDEYSPYAGLVTKMEFGRTLWETIKNLDLADVVTFKGHVNRALLQKYLASCDAHISLSTYFTEDFGYSIAEGLACGAPTVVSAWGGGRDFIKGAGAMGVAVKNGSNGPAVDMEGAMDTVRRILKQDENRKWRSRAQIYYRKHLSAEVVLKNWKKVVKKATKSPLSAKGIDTTALENSYLKFISNVTATNNTEILFNEPIFTSPKDPYSRWITSAYLGLS